MKNLLGVGLITAVALAAVPAAQAASMNQMQGKWSTWGCNVHWGVIGDGTYARYTTVQKLPDNKVFEFPAKISMNNGKLSIDYKYRTLDHKYVYDVNSNDKMTLDRLYIDSNVVFDKNHSNSPWKDKATVRCTPAA